MHKILMIRLYFPLDALHVSDCISPSSRATFISCTSHLVYAVIRRYHIDLVCDVRSLMRLYIFVMVQSNGGFSKKPKPAASCQEIIFFYQLIFVDLVSISLDSSLNT